MMMLKNIRYIYPLFAVAAIFCGSDANAQLNESINVEGKYLPEIIHADRLNTYPTRLGLNVETNRLSYETAGVPASFYPDGVTLPATGWRASRTPSRYRGYLDLSIGSWLNSNLSAGYSFIDNNDTRIGVRLQHNSISLWKPKLDRYLDNIRQFRYDETIGIYASHNLGKAGTIGGSLDYHAGYFNYYGYIPMQLSHDYNPDIEKSNGIYHSFKAPTQTLNDIAFHIGWNTLPEFDDISAYASAGVRYFGYRRYYEPDTEYAGSRETDVNVTGGLNFPTSAKSALGFDAAINVTGYSGGDVSANPVALPAPDTYGLFTLTPYYGFILDNLNVRLGADLDFAMKAGIEGHRYGTFHIAPDVKADYRGNGAALFLHLTGGSQLSTLAGNSALDYYQRPYILNTAPVYTPLDAKLGANFGPFAGFSAQVAVAYRISRGQIAGGLYTEELNHFIDSYPFPTDEYPYQAYESEGRYNLHGFSVSAHLGYELGKLLKIDLDGSYQPQKGTDGFFNGYDRPRLTAEAALEVSPTDKLKFKLAYQYRGVRNCMAVYAVSDNNGRALTRLHPYRLPDLTLLNLGASYSFTDRLSINVQADNLLNRHSDFLPGLPLNGVIVSGGLSFLF